MGLHQQAILTDQGHVRIVGSLADVSVGGAQVALENFSNCDKWRQVVKNLPEIHSIEGRTSLEP